MNRTVRKFRKRLLANAKNLFSMLPDWIGRLVWPNRYRLLPAVMPAIEPMPPAPRRVLIGARNVVGQSYQWARALSSIPGTTAVSITQKERVFRYPVDIIIPPVVALLSGDWQREHVRIRGYSASDVLIESGRPIFGPAFRYSLVREVAALQKRGIRVAVICHGCDVRDFAAHILRNPLSPYRKPEFASEIKAMDRRSANVRRTIRATGVPVLGSTYGVLIDMPEATWCPVVVDLKAWESDRTPFSGSTLPPYSSYTEPFISKRV